MVAGVVAGGDTGATASGGDEYVGIVSVAQCINAGIDNDAISTRVQAVIRVCGLCMRRNLRLNHTAPPSAKDRSAASRSCTNIVLSLRLASPLLLGFLDLVPEHIKLASIEHLGIYHADQHFFHRSVAEPVDDAADRFGGDASPPLDSLKHVSAAVYRMGDVALFFQPSQDGSHR